MSAALGVASLPDKVGMAGEAGARRIFRTGPEQFWVTAPSADNLATRLQEVDAGDNGRRHLALPQPHAHLHRGRAGTRSAGAQHSAGFPPSVFAIGQFALTGIHHTPVLVHRSGEQRYEIYAMRTFALSVWEWLSDAALPFGYEVELPRA